MLTAKCLPQEAAWCSGKGPAAYSIAACLVEMGKVLRLSHKFLSPGSRTEKSSKLSATAAFVLKLPHGTWDSYLLDENVPWTLMQCTLGSIKSMVKRAAGTRYTLCCHT